MSRLEERISKLENNFNFTPHECEELVIHTGVPRPGDDEPGTYPTGICSVCGREMHCGS